MEMGETNSQQVPTQNSQPNPSFRDQILNQKGFPVIIFLLGILISLGLIAGGAFYIKYQHPGLLEKLNLQRSSDGAITKNLRGESNHTTEFGSQYKGKVLFTSKEKGLLLGNIDGTNIEPFNKDLNNQVLSIRSDESLVSPDKSYFLAEVATKDRYVAYYLVSLKDKSFTKIDTEAIKNKYGYNSLIYFWIWTPDSKKIVYSTDLQTSDIQKFIPPADYPALPGEIKRSIGVYDINTKEVEELYSEKEYRTDFFPGRFGVIYYDPEAQTIVYTDDNAKTLGEATKTDRLIGYILDLKTKQKTQFKEPNIANYSSTVHGEYFIMGGVQSQTQSCFPTTIKVFRAIDPQKALAEIVIPDTEERAFDAYVTWSADYNYFAIKTNKCASVDPAEYPDVLMVYSREGKLITKQNVPRMMHAYYGGSFSSIFSNSEQKFLMFGESLANIFWRAYDFNGNVIGDVTSTNLGTPIFWYD